MRIVLAGTGVQPIPPMGYGGVERTIAEYARALAEAGHDPIILNDVRHGRMRDEYPFARSLERQLRPLHYDILHASTPVVARALARHHRPFVYTTHSRHWFDRHGLTDRWGFFLERRAVRSSAWTVALTDRLAERIVADVGPGQRDRLTVIPIGVDAERFRPDWPRRTGHIALGVGAILPAKRWPLAASALAGSGWSFRLVGPVTDRSELERIRRANPAVEVVGEVDDARLTEEYAGADVLVHPSRVELLAGVALQGLAAGLPVLGGDAVRGIVDDGVTGWCAPSTLDDSSTIAFLRERADQLRADPALRRRMGEAGRVIAMDRYAWPKVVAQHLAVYARVRESSGTPIR